MISAAGFAGRCLLIDRGPLPSLRPAASRACRKRGARQIILAYGIFGFGYIVTATFLVAIVRQGDGGRAVRGAGLAGDGPAAIPSVWLWNGVARRAGLTATFAVGCIVEAVGVAASVALGGFAGPLLGGVLLGGTFVAITALGLQIGRLLAPRSPRRVLALMTASFGIGQILGPIAAGLVAEWTGNFVAASIGAAVALLLPARLHAWTAGAGQNRHDCPFCGEGRCRGFFRREFVTSCPQPQAADLRAAHKESSRSVRIFFPRPKLFFISAFVWSLLLVLFWFFGGEQLGALFGLPPAAADAAPIIGPSASCRRHSSGSTSISPPAIGLFYLFWAWYRAASLAKLVDPRVRPDPLRHQFLGADQRRAQRLARHVLRHTSRGIDHSGLGDASAALFGVWQFLSLALVGMTVARAQPVFRPPLHLPLAHGDERLLQAYWPQLRHIEGASQRVQEDTMRFSSTMQGLGVSFIDSVDDADRLPAVARCPVGSCHRVAVCRSDSLSAGRSPPSRGRCSERFCSPSSASSCRAWSSETSVSRPPSARNSSMARTMPTARSRRHWRNSSPMCGRTTSRSTPLRLFRRRRATSTSRPMTVFALLILVPTIAVGKITFGVFQQIVSASPRSRVPSSIWSIRGR